MNDDFKFSRQSGLRAYHFKEKPDHVAVIVSVICWTFIVVCLFVILVIA